MLEQIIYKNHLNETVVFGSDGLYAFSNDLRDYTWEFEEKNNKISSFKRKVVGKSLPIVIVCNTEDEGISVRNRIFETMEKDVLAKKHGTIIIGDYYLKCYITGSTKEEYFYTRQYMKITLTVSTDYPYWIKETMAAFNMTSSGGSEYLDFPYDFPYDFKEDSRWNHVMNTNFVDTDFRIRIYGAVAKPKIYIADHAYSVDVVVEEHEYLTIDSLEKTIYITRKNGDIVNCFNERDRESYVFQKIPVGKSEVSCEGQMKFDVTLIEERSEPRWT